MGPIITHLNTTIVTILSKLNQLMQRFMLHNQHLWRLFTVNAVKVDSYVAFYAGCW